MSRVPGWLGRVGAGITELGKRWEERRAAAEREDTGYVEQEERAEYPQRDERAKRGEHAEGPSSPF